MQAGKYLAFVEFDWHESVKTDARDFTMTCYGAGTTTITDETMQHNVRQFLKSTFIAKLSHSRSGLHRLDFAHKKAPQIKRYQEYNFPEGYNYILVLN